jgi:hypothetical protein
MERQQLYRGNIALCSWYLVPRGAWSEQFSIWKGMSFSPLYNPYTTINVSSAAIDLSAPPKMTQSQKRERLKYVQKLPRERRPLVLTEARFSICLLLYFRPYWPTLCKGKRERNRESEREIERGGCGSLIGRNRLRRRLVFR